MSFLKIFKIYGCLSSLILEYLSMFLFLFQILYRAVLLADSIYIIFSKAPFSIVVNSLKFDSYFWIDFLKVLNLISVRQSNHLDY